VSDKAIFGENLVGTWKGKPQAKCPQCLYTGINPETFVAHLRGHAIDAQAAGARVGLVGPTGEPLE